ncbi:MAG: aminotransferase class V-fold PLP-dependent enzyme, partial [Actinomycetota bacterium]|nr:aminotransferase class V-fold PLP-dependent enzyme [Actinomycetota bacterium]
RLIGAEPSSVALVSSLSAAAATVAHSLPPGRVVVGEREFQSNLFPWLAMERRGAEVVVVPPTGDVVPGEALAGAVDERTVLVAVSEVQSSTGFRVDLEHLMQRVRDAGARLFVNLTQSVGALRFDAGGLRPDYAAVHGYKWMLAPRGAAWLYVRPDRLAETEPLAPSWKSVPEPYAEYYGPVPLAEDARKLDATMTWFSWPGARAALELLLALDPDAVERRSLELADAFREGAAARGLGLVPREAPSQIVGVAVSDPDAVREELRRRGVLGSVRGGLLRLGFHAFNDEADVEAAVAALPRA